MAPAAFTPPVLVTLPLIVPVVVSEPLLDTVPFHVPLLVSNPAFCSAAFTVPKFLAPDPPVLTTKFAPSVPPASIVSPFPALVYVVTPVKLAPEKISTPPRALVSVSLAVTDPLTAKDENGNIWIGPPKVRTVPAV